MKLKGTIFSMERLKGSDSSHVEVRINAVSTEGITISNVKIGNVSSRCRAELVWIVPQEYVKFLHMDKPIIITIRTEGSDAEKLERGEDLAC